MRRAAELDADAFLLDAEYTQAWRAGNCRVWGPGRGRLTVHSDAPMHLLAVGQLDVKPASRKLSPKFLKSPLIGSDLSFIPSDRQTAV